MAPSFIIWFPSRLPHGLTLLGFFFFPSGDLIEGETDALTESKIRCDYYQFDLVFIKKK